MAVIEIDIVDVSPDGETIAHIYIDGVLGEDGGRALVQASKPRNGSAYTLGDDYDVPEITGRSWRVLAQRIARHYGLSGSVRIENEVTERVTTFDV